MSCAKSFLKGERHVFSQMAGGGGDGGEGGEGRRQISEWLLIPLVNHAPVQIKGSHQ